MRLHPRHYVLIAVIFAIFAYNLWRHRQPKLPTDGAAPVVVTSSAPPAQSPAWSAFDHAAALRDAPAAGFDPALQALQLQLRATPNADIDGCLTWLQFYRQGVNHPSTDPQWKDRSTRHLDGCTRFHIDTSA